MDYQAMAEEYYQTAQDLQRTIRKYEEQLNNCKGYNRQHLRSVISKYRRLYSEVIHTAAILTQRAKGNFIEYGASNERT